MPVKHPHKGGKEVPSSVWVLTTAWMRPWPEVMSPWPPSWTYTRPQGIKSWPESIPSGSIINPELALVRQIQERQPRVTRGNYWALGIPAHNLWHRSLQEFSKLSSNWTAAGVKVKYLLWVRTIVRIGNQEKREIFFTLDNKREVKTMTIHKMKSLQQMLNKLGQ